MARMHSASFSRAIASAMMAALVVLTSFGVQAAEHDPRPLPVTAALPALNEAEPMPPWRDFCERYPIECAVDLSEPAIIELTAAAWGMIEAVNERVNSTVKPV